jgi:NADH-quinone oxidoreductase subunit J
MATALLFYFYAAVAIAGALGLVAARKLLHGAMALFATLVAVAGLYLLLGMEFLAAMQLFVYGGAITVLILFALMLAGPRVENAEKPASLAGWVSAIACGVFVTAIVAVSAGTTWTIAPAQVHDTASIATILFSRYALPFEIAGLSLTIALIGAVVIAREDDVRGLPAETPDSADVTPAASGTAASSAKEVGAR